MVRTIKVDIRPIFNKLFDEWNGEGSFRRYATNKQNKQRINDFINDIIDSNMLNKIDMDFTERYLTLRFNDEVTRNDLLSDCNRLVEKGLMAHVV